MDGDTLPNQDGRTGEEKKNGGRERGAVLKEGGKFSLGSYETEVSTDLSAVAVTE